MSLKPGTPVAFLSETLPGLDEVCRVVAIEWPVSLTRLGACVGEESCNACFLACKLQSLPLRIWNAHDRETPFATPFIDSCSALIYDKFERLAVETVALELL